MNWQQSKEKTNDSRLNKIPLLNCFHKRVWEMLTNWLLSCGETLQYWLHSTRWSDCYSGSLCTAEAAVALLHTTVCGAWDWWRWLLRALATTTQWKWHEMRFFLDMLGYGNQTKRQTQRLKTIALGRQWMKKTQNGALCEIEMMWDQNHYGIWTF